MILDKIKTVYGDYCSWYINDNTKNSQNTRQQWQKLVHKYKLVGSDIVSNNKCLRNANNIYNYCFFKYSISCLVEIFFNSFFTLM